MMPARKPYISQASLLTHTHTSAVFMVEGGIQELFPADQHKKGAGHRVEKTAQEEKKKKKERALTHPLLFSSLALSLSSPHHPHSYPLPLAPPVLCCAVPAGFQGAANGLRLIYMQLGWDTCRPSSPTNGAAQESRLNTTGRVGRGR